MYWVGTRGFTNTLLTSKTKFPLISSKSTSIFQNRSGSTECSTAERKPCSSPSKIKRFHGFWLVKIKPFPAEFTCTISFRNDFIVSQADEEESKGLNQFNISFIRAQRLQARFSPLTYSPPIIMRPARGFPEPQAREIIGLPSPLNPPNSVWYPAPAPAPNG